MFKASDLQPLWWKEKTGSIGSTFLTVPTDTTQDISFSSAAALTFLVWDILITLDDEVEYFWSRKWSPVGFAYLFTRYFSALAQMHTMRAPEARPLLLIGPNSRQTQFHSYTPHECRLWEIYRGAVSAILIVALDVVLIARVFALYHEYPNIRRLVLALFGTEVICMVVGLSITIPKYNFNERCIVLNNPPALRLFSSAAIGFQSFLFVLTIYRFIQDLRSGWARIPLANLVVRDGTWVFLLFLCVQAAIYYFIRNIYRRFLFPWIWTISAFCGYRMLLNLRKFAGSESDMRMANLDPIPMSVPYEPSPEPSRFSC